MRDEKLLKAAIKLVKLLDLAADDLLPEKIVKIVKLHSKLAVGSSFIPIPGVDLAAGATSIWSMYVRINRAIGLPFGENVMKSIGSGVATNLAGYAVVSGVASGLKFIPVVGSLTGGIILAASSYAVTLTSGYIYLKALSALAGKHDGISADEIESSVHDFLQNNKEEINSFIKEAKENYKK